MSADAFTVAQNSNAVSHRKNFLKTVRNVDDADSLGAQVPDDAEEEFDLFCRQRCSRFVHDEDAGAAAKGTAISTSCCWGIESRRTSVSGSISAPTRFRSSRAC